MFLRTLVSLSLLFLSCTATPLPQPPSLDYTRMELRQEEGYSVLTATAGAVSEAFVGEVRVTVPSSTSRRSVPVRTDGGFQIELVGADATTPHFVELINTDGEYFMTVLERAGDTTRLADAGPDGDSDESPDAIDCDPGDPMLVGLECEVMCGMSIIDHCDGFDDDCDGTVDEGCGLFCEIDDGCLADHACISGGCISR